MKKRHVSIAPTFAPSEIQTPKQIIEKSIKQYNTRKFILMYSSGNDSHTTLHNTMSIMKELETKIELEMMYWNTGINVAENQEFVIKQADLNGLKLTEVKPKPHFSYESLIERFGFVGVGGHRMTFGFLKWFGMRDVAKQIAEAYTDPTLYLSGRRKLESQQRAAMLSNKPVDQVERNIVTISPLYYMDNDSRDQYMRKHDLKASPVYETVHVDGNCMCGSYATTDELKLLYIFHQTTFNQIMKLDDRLGGTHTGKILDDITECPECGYSAIVKSNTRFDANGIHFNNYKCLVCKAKISLPDHKMPYHTGDIDRGHWSRGVSCKEMITNIPNDDLFCHGCKMNLERQNTDISANNYS